MTRIRVNNFGPIKTNSQWINVDKVTVFVGNQGSGKSTVAKLFSTFAWIEKSLLRGDHDIKFFERKSKFKNSFLSYHRIQNYLTPTTEIEYIGEVYSFHFHEGALSIQPLVSSNANGVQLPQIMYVPAERNFLTYIDSFKELKVASPALREFKDEYKKAQKSIKGTYLLPVEGARLEYDRQNDILHISGGDYKLRISEASSGFQSLVPLYIVSSYLSQSILNRHNGSEMTEEERERYKKLVEEIYSNRKLSDEQRRSAISALSDKFIKSCLINIVEEPEQNLFPTSQEEILASLLRINNQTAGNKLILTTHSPYIVNALPLFVKAYQIGLKTDNQDILTLLNGIIPMDAAINPDTLSVYEFDETTGIYSALKTYKGIPSDENYLNDGLADSNDKFASLLNLEMSCQ